MKAIIKNTSEWVNHWFDGKDGQEIDVVEYPYRTTKNGLINKCQCIECIKNRKGLKTYKAFEVANGSIIPECCLRFICRE